MNPNGRDIAALAILALVTFLTFSPVLKNQFLPWDDDIEITRNPHIQAWTADNIRWMWTDTSQTMRYIPLSWINWSALLSLFGPNPFWFHLEALLLHVANAILLYLLLRRLLPYTNTPRLGPLDLSALAGIGALSWALHPLRTEVVGWATQQRFAQALCFSLLATVLYLRYVEVRTRGAYLASIVAAGFAALTYPTGAVVVAVLLLLDFYPLERFKTGFWTSETRRVYFEKIPYVIVPAAVWCFTVYGRITYHASYEPPPTLAEFGVFPRIMQAFYVWAYYVWRPFFPWRLSPVYTTLIGFSPTRWPFLLSAALVLGSTAIAVRLARRFPALLVIWIAHLVLLVPMLGLLEKPHYTSDRYAYAQGVLWAVVFALALGAIVIRGSKNTRTLAYLSALAVCSYLGVLCLLQTTIWREPVTLFTYTIDSIGDDPARSDLHTRLGLAYLERGRVGDEEAAMKELLAYPAPQDVMLTVGWILLDKHVPAHAAAVLRKALETPADPILGSRLQNALGVALSRSRDLDAAETVLTEAVRLDPTFLEARSNLGQCLMAQGKHNLAVEQFRILVRLSNGNENAVRMLNAALAAAQNG